MCHMVQWTIPIGYFNERPEWKCEEQNDRAGKEAESSPCSFPPARLPSPRVVFFFTLPLWPSLRYPIRHDRIRVTSGWLGIIIARSNNKALTKKFTLKGT